jgi:hypothetical protein
MRSNATAYFNRTPAGAGNRRTWTWSGWVKRGVLGTTQILLNSYSGDENNTTEVGFNSSNQLFFSNVISSTQSNGFYGVTTAVFRDPSAWYHLIFAVDTTQSTLAAALKLYVNGVQQTITGSYGGGTNQNTWVNAALPHRIGQTAPPNSSYFDGYLTEINFIDGQALTPSSFGETNVLTGVWQPKKYTGTYGTNGFDLDFSDNSAATAAAIGKDLSGNGNNWTPNNISVTAGTTYDSMLDSPTPYDDGNTGRGNYCTLNTLAKPSQFPALAEGSLRTGDTNVGNFHQTVGSTVAVNTGKWYWEITLNGTTYNSRSLGIAFASQLAYAAATNQNGMWNTTSDLKDYRAILIANSTTVTPCRSIAGTVTTATNITLPSTLTASSVFMVAMDVGTGAIWFGLNGTWLKSATAAEIIAGTTTNAVYTDIGSPSDFWTPAVYNYIGASSGYGFIANFGQRPFSYTPPTGFKALNTQNLPAATIKNGATSFAATTYTGTGASLAVTNTVNNISFQPDFVWTKSRSNAYSNHLEDAVRGVGQRLLSDSTAAEVTGTNGKLTAFNSNGFTQDGGVEVGASAATYVAWQWNAGGSTVTNTAGSISSQVRANPTAGFSVVTYTGSGANVNVGHGLGVAPNMIIIKSRSAVSDWYVYHSSIGTGKYILLNTTAATVTAANYFTGTSSTVFSATSAATGINTSSATYVAYCFAPVAGYSAFGSFTGNGAADGPFVFTGFRPRFVMIRNPAIVANWLIFDSSRDTYNQTVLFFFANSDGVETNSSGTVALDFVSNGFKIRQTSGNINGSGNALIYMAFAENPFNNSLAR